MRADGVGQGHRRGRLRRLADVQAGGDVGLHCSGGGAGAELWWGLAGCIGLEGNITADESDVHCE